MRNHKRTTIILCMLFSIGLLLFGCGYKGGLDPDEKTPLSSMGAEQNDNTPKVDAPSTSKQDGTGKKDLQVLSPTPQNEPESTDTAQVTTEPQPSKPTTPGDKDKDSKPKYDITEPYDASKPSLMGFTIGDLMDQVLFRFGKPTSEFTIDDPLNPISVLEFPGFAIGSNTAHRIEFIEVNSDKVNPGLNGLRIGDNATAVTNALGKPNSDTTYVMTYKSGGLILKLDMDPNNHTVTSMKLFNEN